MRWLCFLLLVGCAQEHAVDISIVVPSGAPARLEYRLVVGETDAVCAGSAPAAADMLTFADGTPPGRVGKLARGRTAFWIEAWDATCSSCFRGCDEIDVGQDESVEVELLAVSCASTGCASSPPDGGLDADTGVPDADTGVPDSRAPDADTGVPDADAGMPDADTGVPDADVPSGLAIDIAAGANHTCAIRSDGQLFCWGDNDRLQCGSSAGGVLPLPRRLVLARAAEQVGLGEAHGCARFDDGEVRCWGDGGGADQRLGRDETGTSANPSIVLGLDANATDLAVGWWYACVALDDDSARCWGQNMSAELGSCCTEQATSIVVPGLSVSGVAAGNGPGCGLRTDGVLECWGYNPSSAPLGTASTELRAPPGPVRFEMADFGSVTRVEAGGAVDPGFGGHICAIRSGALYCWGRNHEGQVGNGDMGATGVAEPFEVSGLGAGPVRDVSLGGGHSCVVSGDQVYCWGGNAEGQLGDGTTTLRTTPVRSASRLRVRQVAAGGDHTCVIDVDGLVWCWGNDASGQLGSADAADSSPDPVQVMLPLP